MTGDVVVQAFMQPPPSAVPQAPTRSLFNFARLHDVGVRTADAVVFNVTVKDLLLADSNGDLVSAPGAYTLSFETGSGAVVTLPVQLEGAKTIFEPFPQP